MFSHNSDTDDDMLEEMRNIGKANSHKMVFSEVAQARSQKSGDVADILDTDVKPHQLSPEEVQNMLPQIKKMVQVDLNQADKLRDLEDETLVAHMKKRRDELTAASASTNTSVSADDIKVRRALSSIMNSMKDQQMSLQCTGDEAFNTVNNINKVLKGEQPHGYPPIDKLETVELLKILAKKIGDIAKSIDATCAAGTIMEQDLTLARRQYENLRG